MVRRFLFGILVLLAILGAVVAILVRTRVAKERSEFQEQLRLAHAEGIPTTLSEFKSQIHPAIPQENAAPLYQDLSRQPRAAFSSKLASELVFHPDRRVIAATREYMRENSDRLSKIDQAASLPRCCFDRDCIKTSDLLSPYDGKPLIYRYDGKQMSFRVSGGVRSKGVHIPPDPQ